MPEAQAAGWERGLRRDDDRHPILVAEPAGCVVGFAMVGTAKAIERDVGELYELVQRRTPPLGDRAARPGRCPHGRAEQITIAQARVLDAAYAAHSERFVHKPPAPSRLPTIAWINQPKEEPLSTTNP